MWVDFVFNALRVLLSASIKNPSSDRSRRIHEWTVRFEALLKALQEKINGNPAPFNLKALIAANPVTVNAGASNIYIDFIFSELQTVIVNSIKNPKSAAAQRLLVWADRIEALLEDLNSHFEVAEATAPVTIITTAMASTPGVNVPPVSAKE